MTGLNKTIALSFMVVGHTKFTPDSCFGLIKQRFRRTHVQCLSDIASVVKHSATVNEVRLVGTEDGDVHVPTYNWLSHFAPHLKKLSSIKSYHHFEFSSLYPGSVVYKEYSDTPSTTATLLKHDWEPSYTDLPPMIEPPGLSADRQWYFFEKIRPFCEEEYQDICCPLPSVPKPQRTPATTPTGTPCQSPRRPTHLSRTVCPPEKRARTCSNCGGSGHDKRTCRKQSSH